jgi:GNAT superfamily N-acetyltransferase
VVTAQPSSDPAATIDQMVSLARSTCQGASSSSSRDIFGTLPLEQHGFVPLARIPVMVRTAEVTRHADVAGRTTPGPIQVTAATSQADVDQVERLMVDGSPMPALAPWRSGVLFPPNPQAIHGWVMWLAQRDGTPMGCSATFDDGSSVGVYGMAVDPGMRRQGVGRALIDAILVRYPSVPSCLTATEDGFWLYALAGYHTVGLAGWWWRRGEQH